MEGGPDEAFKTVMVLLSDRWYRYKQNALKNTLSKDPFRVGCVCFVCTCACACVYQSFFTNPVNAEMQF